ncbi:hypothetical protein GQ54DRAFT_193458 [Martensiomyces pterosporus]|nr:hypothetical protein GQ54DRAFT_193458 [Martensiomyces pterosporus]
MLTEQLRSKCNCCKGLAAECHLRSFGMFIASETNEIQFADHEAIDALRGPAEEWDAGRLLSLRDDSCSGPLEKYWSIVDYISVGNIESKNNHHYAVVNRKDDKAVRWVQLCVHYSPSEDGRPFYIWHVRDISGQIRCLELSKASTAGEYTLSLEDDGYPHSALLTQSPAAAPSSDLEARNAVVGLLESVLQSEQFAVIHLTGFGAIDTVFPRRLLGWREQDLLERSFIGLLCPEDRSFFCRALKRCYHDGIPQRLNLKIAAAAAAASASATAASSSSSSPDVSAAASALQHRAYGGSAGSCAETAAVQTPPCIYLDCDVTILMPESVQQLVLIVRTNDQQLLLQRPTLSPAPGEQTLSPERQRVGALNEDRHHVIRWMQAGCALEPQDNQGHTSSLRPLSPEPPSPLAQQGQEQMQGDKDHNSRSSTDSQVLAHMDNPPQPPPPLCPQSPALSILSSPGLSAPSSCDSTPETSPTLTATTTVSPPLRAASSHPLLHAARTLLSPAHAMANQEERGGLSSSGPSSISREYRGQLGGSDYPSPALALASAAAAASESGSQDPFQPPPPLPKEPLPSLPPTGPVMFQNLGVPLSPASPALNELQLIQDESDSDTAVANSRTLSPSSSQAGEFRRNGPYSTGEPQLSGTARPPSGLALLHGIPAGTNVSIPMSDIFQIPHMSLYSSPSTSSAQTAFARHAQRSGAEPRRVGPSVVDDVFAPLLEKINLGSIRPRHFSEDEADMVDTRSTTQDDMATAASPGKSLASGSMLFTNGSANRHIPPKKQQQPSPAKASPATP